MYFILLSTNPVNLKPWKYLCCLLFQINRLYLLLTVKESAIEVPTNLEARRRIAFFTNSLFMEMPRAPRVRKMLSFRCVTCFPYILVYEVGLQTFAGVLLPRICKLLEHHAISHFNMPTELIDLNHQDFLVF